MIQLHHGDCLDVLRTMPDASVDAIVTDPPYGLRFMGKKWDYDVPTVEVWAECLRVLKPGGHLLAFAGTRTQHRMAARIEDAGFEIRDMIAWVYGSGFPKSKDISKAIDKAAGAEREVVSQRKKRQSYGANVNTIYGNGPDKAGMQIITAPATPEAQQWAGWGTALKPSFETVTWATKPFPPERERARILANLWKIEARLWLLSSASAAAQSSTSSQSEYVAACATAQWTADDATSTRAALRGLMDTWQCEMAIHMSLSIVSSWRRTLEESSKPRSMCTTETESSTTIDWKTLSCCLSQITPESIIQACSLPGGFNANASTAAQIFNASLALLQSTLTLSVIEHATWQELGARQGEDVRPSLDPVIVARKPLEGAVAANVLRWGTGGINVDGCRVGCEPSPSVKRRTHAAPGASVGATGWKTPARPASYSEQRHGESLGRWPANLIHDGSEEAVGLFPGAGKESAARFFYTAKASKADREYGLDRQRIVYVSCPLWENEDHKAKLRVDMGLSRPRVIAVSGAPCNDATVWSTFLFGSDTTAPYLTATKSTTETVTSSTTEWTTSNSFRLWLTSGCTEDANGEVENGGSRVASAGRGTPSITITSAWTVSVRGVERASSPTPFTISAGGSPADHPTVKPVDLMCYLCRLVTPPGGIVLDPFMGSGSTGKACVTEGFRFIGIERDADSFATAQARVVSPMPLFKDVL